MKKYFTSSYGFLFLALTALIVMDVFVIKDSFAYLNMNPNPYLVLSVLLSAFYGLRTALVSAFACSFVFLVVVHLNLNYEEVESLFDFQFLWTPLLLTMTSVVIGELKQRSLDRIKLMHREQGDQTKVLEFLRNKEVFHEKEISELKKRLVSKLDTVRTFYEIATSFQSVDEAVLLKNFILALNRQFKSELVAIYKINDGDQTLELAAKSEKGNFEQHLSIKKLDFLSSEALKQQKQMTIQDVYSLKNFQEEQTTVLLSAPVIVEGSSRFLVCVYDIPFLDYTPSNFKIFQLYTEWLGKALHFSLVYHHSVGNSIWNDQFQIYRYKYFKERVKEEFDRSKTFMLPLTLMKIRIQNLEGMSDEKNNLIKKLFCGLTQTHIRKLDYVSEGKNENEFFVLFPIFDAENVKTTAASIESEFKKLELQGIDRLVRIESQIVEFNPSMNSYEDFVGSLL